MICTNTDHHVNTLPTIKKEKKRKKKKPIKVCHAITPFAYKLSSAFLLVYIHQDLLHKPHPSQILVNYSINKHLAIYINSGDTFVFQNQSKDKVALKLLFKSDYSTTSSDYSFV